MSLGTSLPFGLRDLKLKPYTDETCLALGAAVDLPNARTLSFAETEDFTELRGDDSLIASHGGGPFVKWELEGGGVSIEAVKVMYGGTIGESGVTPNQIKTLTKLSTDQRPSFRIEGQSISDSGGDLHCVIYRCKATDDLNGEFADGQFFLTGASGVGMKALEVANINKVWAWVQNETATAIA